MEATDRGEALRSRSERWAILFAAPLLLVAPFLNFVLHGGYPLLRPEIGLCVAWLFSVGLSLGALMALGGRMLRVLGVAVLVTLFVDVALDESGYHIRTTLAVFAATVAIGFLLREILGFLTLVVVSCILVSTVLLPVRSLWGDTGSANEEFEARPDLPLVVHLVLDEQIGIEGIPAAFDPDRRIADLVRDFYLDRGFRVFGRAYSRHFDTTPSLSQLVNFAADRRTLAFASAKELGSTVRRNAYFEEMARRGYRINVYQTEYLDFCNSQGEIHIERCLTYSLERIGVIQNAPITTRQRALVIAGVYSRLSMAWSELNPIAWLGGWEPVELLEPTRISALSGAAALGSLGDGIAEMGPGDLVFVHLLLPHFPYAFDSRCELRDDPRTWLLGRDLSLVDARNTAASRAQRYPLYLEQVECVHLLLGEIFDGMKASGSYDAARIFVHGDHGSRLSLLAPAAAVRARMSSSDFIDAFSTLLAVKEPHAPGETPSGAYDRGYIALDTALRFLVLDGAIPKRGAEGAAPWVFLSAGSRPATRAPLPSFAHGTLLE